MLPPHGLQFSSGLSRADRKAVSLEIGEIADFE